MNVKARSLLLLVSALLICALPCRGQDDPPPTAPKEGTSAIENQLSSLADAGEMVPDFKKRRGLLLHELGRSYREQKRLVDAESALKNAFFYLKEALGWYHPLVVKCMNDLCAVLEDEKLSQEGKEVYKEQAASAVVLSGSPPCNESKLSEWLKYAKELGHPSAPTLEGLAYLSGSGVPKDAERARKLFMKSLQHADGCGAARLGLMYLEGDGVGKDLDRARKYLDFADRFGIFYPSTGAENNGSAQFRLAHLLNTGVGLDRRVDRAYLWYSIVSQSGSSLAKEAAEQLLAIKKNLSRQDIEQYDRKVSEWNEQQIAALSPKLHF